jgi:hypothetical protein
LPKNGNQSLLVDKILNFLVFFTEFPLFGKNFKKEGGMVFLTSCFNHCTCIGCSMYGFGV